MGNHQAGREIGKAAEAAVAVRKAGETALAILDRVCSRHRGCDAEFESEDPNNPSNVHPDYDSYTDPHPGAALGMLLIEAFAPNGMADLPRYAPMLSRGPEEEKACDAWWTEVYFKFRDRFGFC